MINVLEEHYARYGLKPIVLDWCGEHYSKYGIKYPVISYAAVREYLPSVLAASVIGSSGIATAAAVRDLIYEVDTFSRLIECLQLHASRDIGAKAAIDRLKALMYADVLTDVELEPEYYIGVIDLSVIKDVEARRLTMALLLAVIYNFIIDKKLSNVAVFIDEAFTLYRYNLQIVIEALQAVRKYNVKLFLVFQNIPVDYADELLSHNVILHRIPEPAYVELRYRRALPGNAPKLKPGEAYVYIDERAKWVHVKIPPTELRKGSVDIKSTVPTIRVKAVPSIVPVPQQAATQSTPQQPSVKFMTADEVLKMLRKQIKRGEEELEQPIPGEDIEVEVE